MKVGDWCKLITLVIVNLGIIILLLFSTIPAEAGVPVLAASLGYVFGNTHGVIETKNQIK